MWIGTFTKSYLEALAPLEACAPAESLVCWLRASCELEAPTTSMCLMPKLPAQMALHAEPVRQRSAARDPGQGQSALILGTCRATLQQLVARVHLSTRTVQAQDWILCWSGLEGR